MGVNGGFVSIRASLACASDAFVLAERAFRAARIVMSMGIGGSSLERKRPLGRAAF
jgi:hypothetical protein